MAADPLARVLRALALNREAGFNFPGHFLRLSFDRVTHGQALLSLDSGAHCEDVDGQVNVGAVALLADIALASSMRGAVGPSARLATVSMGLQLTGAARRGRLQAEASFDGFVEGAVQPQGLARVCVRAGEQLVATGSGAFMMIGKSDAVAPHPLPSRESMREVTLAADELTHREKDVLLHAKRALQDKPGHSFLERFWGYLPRRTATGATCKAWNGMHIGNRVGHAQGGVTFGLAAATANAALPAKWRLVGASAWYVGPGTGEWLTARARILHHGLSTAVIHTTISDPNRRPVLQVVSSHAR